MTIVRKKSAEYRVLSKVRELKEIVAASRSFIPSVYKSLALKEARELVDEFKAEVTSKLHTENAAQAQEIDELKAHRERLHDLVDSAFIKKSEDDDGWCILSVFVGELKECVTETPAQSIAAHDAAIEEEVINSVITYIAKEFSWVDVYVLDAIRDDMSRKHSNEASK